MSFPSLLLACVRGNCRTLTKNVPFQNIMHCYVSLIFFSWIYCLFQKNSATDINVAVLLPLSGDHSRRSLAELAALKSAAEKINTLKLMDDNKINLIVRDTKCDSGSSANAFYDVMLNSSYYPPVSFIVGLTCSHVAKYLSHSARLFNVTIISFGALSSSLSDHSTYTTFYRTVQPDSSFNLARIRFIQHFNWTKIAIISQNHDSFSLALSRFSSQYRSQGFTLKCEANFDGIPGKEQIKTLQENDCRIIIGSFDEKSARQIFCHAYQMGFYGPKIVWILVGWYSKEWLSVNDTDCDVNSIALVSKMHFSVDGFYQLMGKTLFNTNLEDLNFLHSNNVEASPFVKQAFDSLFILPALYSYNETMKAVLTNGTNRIRLIREVMSSIRFNGVSGVIAFNGGDRVGNVIISQLQNNKMIPVAKYDHSLEKLQFMNTVVWQGTRAPVDAPSTSSYIDSIPLWVSILLSCLSFAGMSLSGALLCFQFLKRHTRVIKLSSPYINMVILLGCSLVYVALLLSAFVDYLHKISFTLSCYLEAYLLMVAFSLAFGGMFVKTYRVYLIFSGITRGFVKGSLIDVSDCHLLIVLTVLVFFDSAIIVSWAVFDPLVKQRTQLLQFKQVLAEGDYIIVPERDICYSNSILFWSCLAYGYKALLMIGALCLAWRTRNVKISCLNDSQYIVISVYLVTVLSIISFACSNVISHSGLKQIIVYVPAFLAATTTLGFIFVPNMIALYNLGDQIDPIAEASGLKVMGLTRRLSYEDIRELYHRAEIQNRYFKHDIECVTEEITVIQKLYALFADNYECDADTLQCLSKQLRQKSSVVDYRKRFLRNFALTVTHEHHSFTLNNERKQAAKPPELMLPLSYPPVNKSNALADLALSSIMTINETNNFRLLSGNLMPIQESSIEIAESIRRYSSNP